MSFRVASLLFAVFLSGCASSSQLDANQSHIADQIPKWAGGEPTDVPKRPEYASDYPSVYERKPARTTKLLTDEELTKLQADLTATRNRAAAQAKAMTTQAQSEATKDGLVSSGDKTSGEQIASSRQNR